MLPQPTITILPGNTACTGYSVISKQPQHSTEKLGAQCTEKQGAGLWLEATEFFSGQQPRAQSPVPALSSPMRRISSIVARQIFNASDPRGDGWKICIERDKA